MDKYLVMYDVTPGLSKKTQYEVHSRHEEHKLAYDAAIAARRDCVIVEIKNRFTTKLVVEEVK